MSFSLLLAVLLDITIGEPKRFHPLVGFGRFARGVVRVLWRPNRPLRQFTMGCLAWLVLVVPLVMLGAYLMGLLTRLHFSIAGIAFDQFIQGIVLYLCIAHKSLADHIRAIYRPLVNDNLAAARKHLSFVVSRETSSLDANGVRKAAIESALENGSDAVFAPIFWYVVAGVPGVILYRLANTLDAMWGYKNSRYMYFGRCAARADDLLNWVPARLVAISYGIAGHLPRALWAWSAQAALCSSPNAGPVMASGAGALSISIGGDATYHGKCEARPTLGVGPSPNNADITRTLGLLNKTLVLWCVLILIIDFTLSLGVMSDA